MYQLRTRILNFRVTDEEFERLKAASALQGARCLSEFARSVVLETAAAALSSAPPPADTDRDRLRALEDRLSAIESSVARIRSALVTFNALSIESEA